MALNNFPAPTSLSSPILPSVKSLSPLIQRQSFGFAPFIREAFGFDQTTNFAELLAKPPSAQGWGVTAQSWKPQSEDQFV